MTTQSVTITATGIQQLAGEAINTFYSNENGMLHVSLPSPATVEVYDIVGQKVFAKYLEASSHTIDMNGAVGTYVVRVITKNGSSASKFTVTR